MAVKKKRGALRSVAAGDWRIVPRLLRARIKGGGPAVDCDGSCCRYGAWASVEERDLILKHAAAVKKHMDDSQPRRVSEWFSKKRHFDEEFVDGVSYGTRVHRRKCGFRRRDGLCSLQATEPDIDLPRGTRLKPFACYFFPLTSDGEKIDFDPLTAGLRPCCTLAARGETRGLDAWSWELRLLIGRTAFQKVKARLGLGRRK